MFQFGEIKENYVLYVLALVLLQVPHTISGANNLNMYDGVTNPYIIGGDIFFEIVEPSELSYTYRIRPAKNFGAEFNESFSLMNTKLVIMDPEDGCTPPDNQELLEGHVALAVRGCLGLGCNHIRAVFVRKTCQRTPQELCQMVLWACYEPKKKFELFYYLVGRPLRTAEKAIKPFAYGRCIGAALECSFLHKTMVAEGAGARALIITEQDDNPFDPSADLFIEMIDDRSDRDASIPAAFLLGRNGVQIQNTLESLDLPYAIINIPINMTYVSIDKMNQPPWISW